MPRRASVPAAVLLCAGAAFGAITVAGARVATADGADVAPRPDLLSPADLTPTQKRLAEDVFARVVCKCPTENWSKTLAMCPDGCAIPQKQEILRDVLAGASLEAIVASQKRLHGPKADAAPGAAHDGTWVVVAAVGAGALFAAVVLTRWSRDAAERRAAPPSAAANASESDAVERELREID